jgi:aryl-alcohol dehydrogenase-like predicted oxidoreductase
MARPGSAERNFGRILQEDFLPWRDELIISTKAGYTMWEALTATGGHANICWQASIKA